MKEVIVTRDLLDMAGTAGEIGAGLRYAARTLAESAEFDCPVRLAQGMADLREVRAQLDTLLAEIRWEIG